jgi:hypothetical protein
LGKKRKEERVFVCVYNQSSAIFWALRSEIILERKERERRSKQRERERERE